ncbi:MAG: BMP family ABC transporter substrate-binding protein [Gaiellaceae bacterium]
MTNQRWLVRLSALLAVGVVAFGVVGCGGGDDDGGSEFSIALVTDTAGPNDRGFNEFSIAGLNQAGDELGVDTRVYVSAVEDDYLANLTAAAEDGHDLVIGVGFLLVAQTIQIATEYPDTFFAGVDHFYGGDGCEGQGTCEQPNALGMQYPSEEAGYLAGIVAALTTQSKTVSTVGGIKIPPVDNWIAGFQQGVADTDSSVKTLNAYSQDFVDQAKCKEIALDQISQGSDIVFQVAGDCGLGAIDAACEQGKWAIGVDADQSAQGDCVITSALKPLQESVFQVINSVVDGTFEGGQNLFFGIQEYPDSQLLAPLFENPGLAIEAPDGVQEAVDEALEKLKSGEIDPPSTVE